MLKNLRYYTSSIGKIIIIIIKTDNNNNNIRSAYNKNIIQGTRGNRTFVPCVYNRILNV